MKRRLCLVVVWAAAAVGLLSRSAAGAESTLDKVERAQKEREQIIHQIAPSVISVFRVNKKTGELAPGAGSGVIITADGYALSNYHVTGSFEELRAGLPGGRIAKARLCGVDPTGDIAMLKIESEEPMTCARLGSSGALAVGEWVIAMGNPFLLATDFQPTVSLGVVSGLHRYLPGAGAMQKDLIYADAIQIDAAINPGNSGGPLFNMRGELVGINGRITPRQVEGLRLQRLNAGIGFAVPIDCIKPFLDELKAGHRVDRGYLGITKMTAVDDGVKIDRVNLDSPAELFDFHAGDIILSLDGREVRDPGEVQNIVQTRAAGTRLKIRLRRGEETLEKDVQLAGTQSVAMLKLMELGGRARSAKSLYDRPSAEPTEDKSKGTENSGGKEKMPDKKSQEEGK